jgi:SNF2 family DNA or RNA helicase
MTSFFHDQASNTLVYPRHALITQTIPEAREINGQFVAVPRSLHNLQVLRHYNFPVSPVITDANYDWPRNKRSVPHPYESQKVTANFFVLHPRCFCLSDMGVGKTLAAAWSADFLMRLRQHAPGSFRALIVCPISIMQQWANNIFEHFLGKRSVIILHGSAAKRVELLKQPADFYIINHDGVGVGAHTRKKFELDGFSKALAERDDIKLCIVDEASAYKDSRTKRHRLARMILGHREYLWLMTGTPTPNSPTDAYGLAKLVNDAYGKSFTTFQLDTMIKVTQFKWAPQRDGYEKARRLLQPSIRYAIEDVWDGPEMTTQQREIELTPDQKKMMADLKKDLMIAAKSGALISAVNEAAARTKFIQISLGAIYDGDHTVHYVDASPRLSELKDVIEQASGKILIFACLTSVVELLHKELKRNHSCEIVNGNTSQKDRARIFQTFQQESEPRILIADPGTMAHGLNLWMAQAVIWYGPCDKTELYLQANKRAHRPGQKHPVTVVQFVSNKLEKEIFHRLETNTSLQGVLLDMVREDSL